MPAVLYHVSTLAIDFADEFDSVMISARRFAEIAARRHQQLLDEGARLEAERDSLDEELREAVKRLKTKEARMAKRENRINELEAENEALRGACSQKAAVAQRAEPARPPSGFDAARLAVAGDLTKAPPPPRPSLPLLPPERDSAVRAPLPAPEAAGAHFGAPADTAARHSMAHPHGTLSNPAAQAKRGHVCRVHAW
jgi:hypothetical protein